MKLILAIAAIIFGSLILGAVSYWLLFMVKIARLWKGDKRDETERIYD